MILLTIVQDKNQIKNIQEIHYIVKIPKAQEMNNNSMQEEIKISNKITKYEKFSLYNWKLKNL